MSTERLQKKLAAMGFGSRREIERWIEAGEILVNGRPAKLGQQVGPGDKLVVRGQPVVLEAEEPLQRRVLVYHKPEGEVTTRRDEAGRPNVFDALPPIAGGRWINIGRLDLNTSGLLLFTNDGELANRLMHPSHAVEREYAVRIYGEVDAEMLQRLQDGVALDDGPAKFDSIVDAGGSGRNHWFHVTLHEGRNREVRRLWESQGVEVSRLIRVRFASVELSPRLRPGRWRELSVAESNVLADLVGLPAQERKKPAAAKSTPPWKRKPAAKGRGGPRRR